MRPEYIKCIAHTHADKIGQSLCGRAIGSKGPDGELRAREFVFIAIDHWFYNEVAGGRLIGCNDCLDTIRKAVAP